MYTKLFWKDFAERLIATLVQVGLGLFGANSVENIPLGAMAITMALAGLAVFAKALAAAGVKNTLSPASFAPVGPDLPAVAEEEVKLVLNNDPHLHDLNHPHDLP